MAREHARLKTKVDTMDDSLNSSLKGLEKAVTILRSEYIPSQVNDVMTQMTNMAAKFSERMDLAEREIQRITPGVPATAPSPAVGPTIVQGIGATSPGVSAGHSATGFVHQASFGQTHGFAQAPCPTGQGDSMGRGASAGSAPFMPGAGPAPFMPGQGTNAGPAPFMSGYGAGAGFGNAPPQFAEGRGAVGETYGAQQQQKK